MKKKDMTSKDFRNADSPLFSDLLPRELEQLQAAVTVEKLNPEDVLFKEDDEGDRLHIVESGLLGVYVANDEGEPTQVITRGTGAVVGEMSVLTGEPRSATIKALMPTTLLTISGDDFMSVARGSPTLLLNINRILSQRLHDSDRRAVKRKSEVIVLVGNLPPESGQWLANNLSVAVAEVSAKSTLVLSPAPTPENVPQFPNRVDLQSFLDGSQHFPEPDLGMKPLEKVLSVEPRESLLDFKELNDLSPFFLALGRGTLFSDYIVVNLTSVKPGSLAPLISEMTPELLEQISKTVWVAQATENLQEQANHARQMMETANLPYEYVSWLVLHDGPTPTQGMMKRWKAMLGTKIVGVVSTSGAESGLSRYVSAWAKERVWQSLIQAARHLTGKTVGVAFGEGGAKGFAHIGVIKAFEELGISIDYIAGTSSGSVIGSLWALGNDSRDLTAEAKDVYSSWRSKQLFVPTLPRKSILWGGGLRRLIESLVGDRTFDNTFTSFAAVSADINTGRRVIIREGRISDAVVASASIPVVFPAVRHQGKVLVDGGLVEPVPVPTLKVMGADVVVAINVSDTKRDILLSSDQSSASQSDHGRDRGKKPIPGILGAYFNVYDALREEVASNGIKAADLCLRPEFEARNWYEFGRMDEYMASGQESVHLMKDELQRLLPWIGRDSPGK